MFEDLLKSGKVEFMGKKVQIALEEFDKYVLPKLKQGELYYRQKNTAIMSRTKQMYLDGQLVNDPYKSNEKVASGFMKILTKQKVSYSVNDKLTISTVDNFNEQLLEQIKADLGKDFKNKLKKLGIEASKKSFSGWQVYVQDNVFKYKLISTGQLIPVYEDDEMVAVIKRWLEIDENGKSVEIADVYTENYITTFKKVEGKFVFVTVKVPFTTSLKYVNREEVQSSNSWGIIPFSILNNNDEKESDLESIKTHVDIYDVVNSDFANELLDTQQMYWIIKNYDGQDLNAFIEQLKANKAVPVGEDGDVTSHTVEIPVEARKVMLDITEKNIYKFGMGVDTNSMGDRDTNVAIKSRYSNFNLKANDFEQGIQDAFQHLLKLLNRFYEITGKPTFDPSDLHLTFSRSIIVNEVDVIKSNNESVGAISDYTRLANDPRVDDPKAEIERMRQEREEEAKMLGGGLGFNEEVI